ncbi:HNH endonuclease [Actinomadura sp. WAC 06369]|uniref:HNH endonuclease n=1 Tax=Actinomadura sp. WAC 06369 TaxID=2203193 RepID=UPI000F79F440|nr:HNH endonuclease [Actinomadura sp. WAC 06369]RSN64672.1 HNH endonuclease [Actinomadura sp. WAC 06369]
MVLAEISRVDVLRAIAEYRELGRERFLSRYGFGEARQYLLVYEEGFYDSKAIAGVAHRYATGTALTAGDFSGGAKHAVRTLKRLGFEVRTTRNPPWGWDELVLACDLVAANGWRRLMPEDKRVLELSDLLQRLPIHPLAARGEKFRNPNGVAHKTSDIATRHPDYQGKPTNGGVLDLEVLQAFLDDPARMHASAELIRAGVESGTLLDVAWPDAVVDEDVSAPEGSLLLRKHFVRERDPKLRKRRIEQARKQHGDLACEVCGFDFERTYGPRGADYIECHHVVPLHVSGETKTRLQDLALLCANCHRMVHRASPWPTPEELRTLVVKHRDGAAEVEAGV